MKKTILLSLLTFNLFGSYLFSQDTLRNLLPTAERTIDIYQTGWGFLTGSNHLYREEFAEKYYIQGTRTLVGVISQHAGKVANVNNISQLRAYNVGSNKLPSTLRASANVPYGQINLTGSYMLTMFPTSAQVSDSFFVSFNLTDYAHGGFDGDTVGLLYGVNGSRPNSDLSKFGRNAIRRHSHSGVQWRDFYTQNFTPIATHFAIFPILSSTVGIDELKTEEFKISSVYPNPFTEFITLKMTNPEFEQINLFVYNDKGQIVVTKTLLKNDFDFNGEIKIDCNVLSSGKYILFVRGINSGLGIQLIKK